MGYFSVFLGGRTMTVKKLEPEAYEDLWFDRSGFFAPKNARYIQLTGTDNSNVVLIKFEVPLKTGKGLATMSIPLTKIDAVNLLANLLEAQQQGLLPAFARPSHPKDVN